MASPYRQIKPHPFQVEGGPILAPIPHPPEVLKINEADFQIANAYANQLGSTYNHPEPWFYEEWTNRTLKED